MLVLYGTTDGHTARVARAIGETLHARGAEVDVVRATRSDPNPDDYSAIVVAASVHAGGYQRPIRKWVRTYVASLANKPTAFVTVCLGILQHDQAVQQEVATIVNRFLIESGWRPTMKKVVAGALLYRRYNWIKRWVMKRIVAKAGGDTDTSRDYEYTDWRDLQTFAEQFAQVAGLNAEQPGQVGEVGELRQIGQVAQVGRAAFAGRVRASGGFSTLLLSLALAAVPHLAAAQQAAPMDWHHGSLLSGSFGAQAADSNVSPFAGAGLGWEFSPRLAIEGRANWFRVNDGPSDFTATLAAHMPLLTAGAVRPFVSAGAGMYRATIHPNAQNVPAFYRARIPDGTVGLQTFEDFVATVGGGLNVFVSSHVAIRPDVNLILVTTRSDVRPVGVYGFQVVYHFAPHTIGQ
jgi:menaquinone-dependent protoporphyrinogen oxidase